MPSLPLCYLSVLDRAYLRIWAVDSFLSVRGDHCLQSVSGEGKILLPLKQAVVFLQFTGRCPLASKARSFVENLVHVTGATQTAVLIASSLFYFHREESTRGSEFDLATREEGSFVLGPERGTSVTWYLRFLTPHFMQTIPTVV